MTLFRIDAPIASFRPYAARDYQTTFPYPPPSTVFGCLLSFLGIEIAECEQYHGTHVAIAVRTGDRSTILRKMRRDPKSPKKHLRGVPQYRPEYQELLTDVSVWVGVWKGDAVDDLASDLADALQTPSRIERYGVVSLGESSFLVDSIRHVRVTADPEAVILRPTDGGRISLTTWVDNSDRTKTRFRRFEPAEGPLVQADGFPIGP